LVALATSFNLHEFVKFALTRGINVNSYLLLPKLRLLPNPLLLEPELLLCPNPPLRTRFELLRVLNDRCDLTGLLKLLRLLALDDIDDELVGLNVL